MLLNTEEPLGQARLALEANGAVVSDLLATDIRDSWQRCLASGLDPNGTPKIETVSAERLRLAREQRAMVYRLASAELRTLYQQIAGTNFMVALADPDGLLLDAVADLSFANDAQAAAIEPGTIWDETHCGTNALGTTIATGTAHSIHGGEHFFRRHNAITCVAAPVFGPDGTLACVLDASSDCRSRQSHTRALVGMAATQIENLLLRETHARHYIINFHSRPEYLSTLSAGILVFSDGGRVLAANRQARFLLAGLPVVLGRRFEDIFRTQFGELHDACARAAYGTLQDRVGSIYVATIETPKSSRRIAIGSPPAAAVVDFVANDPQVAAGLRLAGNAASRRMPVLIRGATGTGKELLARYAHKISDRRGAFVPVNCAALTETLIEAELFGYADGAYTGARRGGAVGLVAEADGGTLFLDEIGDMKRPLQAVLLRLLDDWTIRPVGATRHRAVDVLLVAATNADLEREIANGNFRADLLYRLNTAEITLPALAQRSDFAAIARHLLARFAPDTTITDEAAALLATRSWPGNIRELKSVLLRLAFQQNGGALDCDIIQTMLGGEITQTGVIDPSSDLRSLMRARIRSAYQANGGNVSATARCLGVSRNTVYRSLEDG